MLDQFPDWREVIKAELTRLAARHRAWFKKCRRSLADLFDSPESVGVEALLRQRPQTAFPGMTDGQFRQYAYSAMSDLSGMMDSALADGS